MTSPCPSFSGACMLSNFHSDQVLVAQRREISFSLSYVGVSLRLSFISVFFFAGGSEIILRLKELSISNKSMTSRNIFKKRSDS